jgi:hypothetical protein
MRFKTFRNAVLIPAGVLAGLLFLGGFAMLYRSCQSAEPEPETTQKTLPANTPAPRPLVASNGGNNFRDQLIVDYLNAHRQAAGDKIKDALPREAFKVNLYADNASPTWNRLKIDLDRDEKWDEKWDLENGQPVKRHVSTRDNEVYDLEFRWQAGGWTEKK